MTDIDAKKIKELLPCPFCGGDAHLVIEDEFSRFRCGQCGATGAPAEYGREYDATAAWNRRASHSLASASGGEDAELCERLEIKADMIQLGEGIAWGSDSEIMREAAARIRSLSAQLAEARREISDNNRHEAQLRALIDGLTKAKLAWREHATSAESEASALRERVGLLEKALEPFAEAATKGEIRGYPPNYFVGATEFENARRARTALEDRE